MIRVRQVKVPLEERNFLLEKISRILKVKKENILNYKIVKESIDARKKENILLIYEVDVELNCEDEILRRNKSADIFKFDEYCLARYKYALVPTKVTSTFSGNPSIT